MAAPEGAELVFLYTLAEKLGKTVAEIRRTMPVAEREGWAALMKLRERYRQQSAHTHRKV